MKKLSIRDLEVKNKKVLVRVDFNVPLSSTGEISDDTRIRAALPTIEYIIEQNGIAILMSHLGKPKGKPDPKYSLKPVATKLSQLINKEVLFTEDCIGPNVKGVIERAKPGDVVLLENLRFHPEEEKNDPTFAKALAELGEIYVNDAFATAHRAHSSTEGVTRYFDNPAAGFLMEKEIEYLSYVVESPKHPYVAIIGGAKITDKLGVIKNLSKKVDHLLLGGGLIFNFFKAQGYEIGNSIFEPEMLEETRNLLNEKKIKLPTDVLVAEKIAADAYTQVVYSNEIPTNWSGVDIGPQTCQIYKDIIKSAQTIVWAGPIGIFEIDKFANGSREIGLAIADATKAGATSVVGGGDTVACLSKLGLKDKVSFVSTAGGASLEFLEGRELPGIKALKDI
ncbi:MAG: phosphoglycerate kinase [candidate division WOR-3 bacterium]|nr:phosphoglycerate kinase [candidate division WOR-3 bacterium]